MSYPMPTLSFPAGASSTNPDRSRFIGPSDSQRLLQLANAMPELRRYLNSSSLVINAYPASLGLGGVAPLVDTYLHDKTFIAAFRSAERESRPVVLAAQPLMGADLLLEFCARGFKAPSEMLWAVGGYPLPRSLEVFIQSTMRSLGCEIRFLYSYGVAEIGHTCFAATERCQSGHPIYSKVAPTVTAEIVGEDHLLRLTSPQGRAVLTEDYATNCDDRWTLISGNERLHPSVLEELESWGHEDWSRRTGYLHATVKKNEKSMVFQLRREVDLAVGPSEIDYFNFWRLHGGSLTCKPVWKLHPRKPGIAN